MPIDFTTRKLADPASVAVTPPASDDTVQGRTAAGADRNFALGNLSGMAPVVVAADTALYATGATTWASYSLTAVGRTFLAATTQAAQRVALGLGSAATVNTGTSGSNIPLLDGANTWSGQSTYTSVQTYDFGASVGVFRFTNIASEPTLYGVRGDFSGSAYSRSDIRFRNGTVSLGAGPANTAATPNTWIDIAPASIGPRGSGTMSCGTAAAPFTQYYGTNTTISTSDERLKTAIRALKPAEVAAFSAIARLPAIWRWTHRMEGDENCEPEGWEARKHGGPTVQAAMAIMEAHGLDPFAYACFCYDEWEAEDATYDEDGQELTPAREAGDRYSFRKEELLCLCLSAMAVQHDELAEDLRVTKEELSRAMELVQELLGRVTALEASA